MSACILAMLLLAPSAARPGETPAAAKTAALSERAAAMDARERAALAETIAAEYRSVRAVVIFSGDEPVFDYYRRGTGADDLLPVNSVTKSVTSVLVGVALGQGRFGSLDQSLGDLLPEAHDPGVDPRVSAITIRHLLTMTSGFDPGSGPRSTLPPSALWRWSLHRPMLDAPGQRFAYDNQAAHLLSVLLTRAVGEDPARFAERHLFGPLGIGKLAWARDSEGHLQGAFGLSLTARDMAKIGSLVLHGGRWQGRQVVPEAYATEAMRAHNRGGPPVVAADYGYLWWVTRPPNETAAAFAAGSGGQLIYVVPALDLVVAIASTGSGAGGRDLINRLIIRAVQRHAAP